MSARRGRRKGHLGVQACVKRHTPDLIISDVMMPGMDGFELFKYTKGDARLSAIPFIFISAMEGKEIPRLALKLGAIDFINKPFKSKTLLEKIDSLLRIVKTTKQSFILMKGILSEQSVDELLMHLESEGTTGTLTLLHPDDKEGEIILQKGNIQKIIMDDLSDTEALETMMQWDRGSFVFTQKSNWLEADNKDKEEISDSSSTTESLEGVLSKIHGVRECILVSKEGILQNEVKKDPETKASLTFFLGFSNSRIGSILKMGKPQIISVEKKDGRRFLVLESGNLYICLFLHANAVVEQVINNINKIIGEK